MNTDERPTIKLWNYLFDHCHCQYIKSERAWSAFITVAGYDYQEYALDDESAKIKLADKVAGKPRILDWFKEKFDCA